MIELVAGGVAIAIVVVSVTVDAVFTRKINQCKDALSDDNSKQDMSHERG